MYTLNHLENERDEKKVLLPKDVFKHNKSCSDEDKWVIYKDKVFDNKRILNVLNEMDIIAPHQKCQLWRYLEDRLVSCDSGYKKDLETMLQRHCLVGPLVKYGDPMYWVDIRADVKIVLDDLIRKSLKDIISNAESDYMNLMQQWMAQFRDSDPHPRQLPHGDPNQIPFPLLETVAYNAYSLRDWITSWQPFDFELPEQGAWSMIETERVDVSDSHEVFTSSLRPGLNMASFDTSIEGRTAWRTIQVNVIADDIPTQNQIDIEKARSGRKDMEDRERMKKRRNRLMGYFLHNYKGKISRIESFQNWAEEMEKAEKTFLELCG